MKRKGKTVGSDEIKQNDGKFTQGDIWMHVIYVMGWKTIDWGQIWPRCLIS